MVRLFLFLSVAPLCLSAFGQEAPRFNRDVRPILSDKCFPCHGPDSVMRKAGLRLDSLEGALANAALMPGDAAASTVVQRINHSDPQERMPPTDSELSLSAEEIDVITRWIANGAEYEPHWSFVPPADVVAVPTMEGDWVRDPIDAFVAQRLEPEGLSPSAEATRETWLRRVSFDLTGLPPTLEEIDAFLADESAGAHERVVERLLASPAFGEHMAVYWLDAARFADTFGYQADVEMDMWPWRDWVIKALNDNLPYDDFLSWQIAGDLLPGATQEQRLATGFNRLHRQTNEGGSINEEFRQAYIGDRTETFATAAMGLTFGCARCHDHKFDPISQKDYYSLAAFFSNIDESGLYSHFTHTAPAPALLLYKNREEERHAMLKRKIARLEEELAESEDAMDEGFAAWSGNPERPFAEAKPVLAFAFDTAETNATPDGAAPERLATFIAQPQLIEGHSGKAMAFTGDDGVQSEGAAAFERCDPFSIAMWIKVDKHIPKAVVVHRCKAESDAASRGYEIMLDEGRPVFSLIHFWPGNAIRVRALQPLAEGQWTHLAVRYDGASRAAGAQVFVDGALVEMEVIRDNLYKTIQYEGDPKVPFTVAQRMRDSGLKGGALDDLMVFDVCLSQAEISALATGRTLQAALTDGGEDAAEEYYALRMNAVETREKLHDARSKEAAFVERVQTMMVMEELLQPKSTFMLARGEYDKPGEAVSAETPHALPPLAPDAPRNRLGLAKWLTDPRHPLTARVAVNRFWQHFFGRGLVETQEDFGNQGRPPSHPELLDYLARHFVDTQWDVKALCRSIVLSATYRQESHASAEARARDPHNVLLARGPRFRLSAEQIRDEALAASGLLVAKVGGPSVKPYQPPGLWEDASSSGYAQDTGEGLYRRSIYTFIKRTVPPPSILTFDGITREVCTARRERTATPLQALVLLNDPQYVEAARLLAEQVMGQDEDSRVSTLFRRLMGRAPSPDETAVLAIAHEEQQAWYAARAEDALRYASSGETPRNESLDPVQVAALSAVAQAVMNLDEFQVRR